VPHGQLVEAWFDGSCEPVNPGGTAFYGAVIVIDGEATELSVIADPATVEITTNNVAECRPRCRSRTFAGERSHRPADPHPR
jgi:ribonuclease HI